MSNRTFLIAALLFLSLGAQAQEAKPRILTLEEAVDLALKNNHDLYISAATAEKAANASTLGNAGGLPNLVASAGANYSNQNSDLEFATGQSQTVDGAQSAAQNASLGLNQVLFAGGSVQTTWKILKKAATMASLAEQQQMLNTIAQAHSQYYGIALLTETLGNAERNVQLSQERFQRAELTHQLGGSNTTELLSAEVDLNRDQINLMNIRTQLYNAKLVFRNFIGLSEPFEVNQNTDMSFVSLPGTEALLAQALQESPAVQMAKTSQESAELQFRLTKATLFPTIGAQVSYGFNQSQAEAGFLASSQQTGLNAGVSLTYNLFGGGRNRVQRQNAALDLDIAERRKVQAEENMTTALMNAVEIYVDARAKHALEVKSAELAQKNFERTSELFALGKVSHLQLREAQLGWFNALNGKNSALFQAKNAEIAIWQLVGKLE